MIFFTADNHFGHANIIEYARRPFSSVEEMDAVMVDNWNRVVNPDDTVYLLGDFAVVTRYSSVAEAFARLNGKINVVPGGRDKFWVSTKRARRGELSTRTGHYVRVMPAIMEFDTCIKWMDGKTKRIALSHYPLVSWDKATYNAWMFHGHLHGRAGGIGLSLDVGVDTHRFTPWSLDEAVEWMRSIEKNYDPIEHYPD